jgi:hypothetical protein
MGRHRKAEDGECPFCEHEAHEPGLCYHCGIFADQLPEDNPCSAALLK